MHKFLVIFAISLLAISHVILGIYHGSVFMTIWGGLYAILSVLSYNVLKPLD